MKKRTNPFFVFWQWPGSHGSLLFAGAPAITHFSPVIVTVLLSVLTVAPVCDSLAIGGACLVLKKSVQFCVCAVLRVCVGLYVFVCVAIKEVMVLFPCFSEATSHL